MIDPIDTLPHADAVAQYAGHDMADSMAAVINAIPMTRRDVAPQPPQRAPRPRAYLYVRPGLLGSAEKDCAYALADAVAPDRGLATRADADAARERKGWVGPGRLSINFWIRLNGELPTSSRTRASGQGVSPSVIARDPQDNIWWLSFCHRHVGGALRYRERMLASAGLLGVLPAVVDRTHGETGLLVPSIHQLVLATYWGDTIAAAITLALWHAPRSDEWNIAIDQALANGEPWAERVAMLSLRPARDPIIRALAWLH